MAAPATSTEFERSQRKAHVARRRLQGWTQARIAEELRVTQSAISQLCKTIEEEWQESTFVDVNQVKTQAALKIDLLESEYWDAWERSKAPRKTKSGKQKGLAKKDENGKTKPASLEQTVREESQVGDPRFLEGARRCNEDRIALYGVAAATKIDFNDVSKRTNGQLTQRLTSLLTKCGLAGDRHESTDGGGASRAESDPGGAGATS